MPIFTDPTDSVSSVITNYGREIIAKSVTSGLAFRLEGFRVGRYGYNTVNPVKVLAVNPADSNLGSIVFPVTPTDLAPFVTIETPMPNVVAPVCRLSFSDANYGLGELGIWAKILNNVDPAYPVDTTWLFSLVHFPLMSKTTEHNFVMRVLIAL